MSQKDAPLILGLTGGIGMGKSTVARMMEERGVPVLDADKMVHEMYSQNGAAVGPVAAAFPSAVVDGAVDRPALSACVVGDPAAMKQLEGIVHPLVAAARAKGLRDAARAGAAAVALDVPLLFETGGEAGCDLTVTVSAPAELQRRRVSARKGMTQGKLDAILARQLSDEERRSRADVIIDTGCSIEETDGQVAALVASLPGRPRDAYLRSQAAGADGGAA